MSAGVREPVQVMNRRDFGRALDRLAHEIVERNQGVENLALIGIRTGGAFLAERLQKQIGKIEGVKPLLGIIDITLYRDDFANGLSNPVMGPTEIDFSLAGKKVVLVDDVLFTGRTVRAAMDALMDHGRPTRVQLVVMCDRGHRELPIQPDYTGIVAQTTRSENVKVRMKELGEEDGVWIEPPRPRTLPVAVLPPPAKERSKRKK
ncbi:MAG: Bifunctional protein PyrR [Myxococcota bacterium]|nr:Bifunctional protein PyrR [Myxococcota bacterium]